jgi:hypothetical protein
VEAAVRLPKDDGGGELLEVTGPFDMALAVPSPSMCLSPAAATASPSSSCCGEESALTTSKPKGYRPRPRRPRRGSLALPNDVAKEAAEAAAAMS